MVVALLVVVTVLVAVTLVVLVVGLVTFGRRLRGTASELEVTLRALRESVLPLADDARQVLANTDGLVRTSRDEVERIGRLTESLERLIEGRTVAEAAGKAVSTSRATLIALLEGAKQAVRTLRGAKDVSKEESSNEQQR